MNQLELNSFMVLNINGEDKISYTYNEFDENGNQISCNNKKNFNVNDNPLLLSYINGIKNYIIENELSK